jgi:hypothetical protein
VAAGDWFKISLTVPPRGSFVGHGKKGLPLARGAKANATYRISGGNLI